jgi:DNA-directed RNA polymerase subunit RPC12/RpoP
MGNRFASGKKAIAECDRCGQQFKLKKLRTEIIKTKKYELLVCPECWDPDQPQLQLGMFPVDDPQALRNPRRDTTYVTSGLNANGNLSGGSRDIQWGWNPVGGASGFDSALTPNTLALTVQIGTVTISVS